MNWNPEPPKASEEGIKVSTELYSEMGAKKVENENEIKLEASKKEEES